MHCSKKKKTTINKQTFHLFGGNAISCPHLVTLYKYLPSPKDNLYVFNSKIERISYDVL